MSGPNTSPRDETSKGFNPPPGARFFIAADFDGNDASFIEVPSPKPGSVRTLARDGSPAERVPASGREVSREEFEAFADQSEDSRDAKHRRLRLCVTGRDRMGTVKLKNL